MSPTRHGRTGSRASGDGRRRRARAWLPAALLLASLLGPRPPAEAQDSRRLGPLDEQHRVTYFIAEGAEDSAYRDTDRQLAEWALAAWERNGRGAFHFVPGPEASALVRIYWVRAGGGEYGEMQPVIMNGRRGAAVFIRPDTDALGPEIAERARSDELFRDTIVYLTCVHELGHALGLVHTANFDDVMYFFGYGGDIVRFFARYRDKLHTRADIAGAAGVSAGDLEQLHALYGGGDGPPARLPKRPGLDVTARASSAATAGEPNLRAAVR